MKNVIKILAAVAMVVIPLYFFYQKDHNALADSSASKFTVSAATVNVRDDADISSKIIGTVHMGETFELLQSKNGWDQIKLSNDQTGWIYHPYITSSEKTEATVDAIVLNVRQRPSLSGYIVGKLKSGSKITVYQEQSGWAKIESSNGINGWVYQQYITKNAPVNKQPTNTAATPNTFDPTSKEPLKGKTIVLDPGHGGKDDGTTGNTGTHEKDLTLATAEAVQEKLEKEGAHVIMTRTNDTYISLEERATISRQNQADAFISFHYNWSSDPSASGLIDFYYQQSRDNALASDVINNVAQKTGLKSAGARFDDLYVLRNNTQPSTLIELGFLSNQQDESTLENYAYQENVADGVYQGLLDYFSGKS